MDNLSLAGTSVSLVSDLLRYLSFLLDLIAYSLIPVVFDLIYKLYDLPETISSVKALKTLAESLYSFLAIFMFFKVAFSLLGMLVDPNMIADKEKGAGKIVTNIFITLALIIIVPIVFDYAFKAQYIIMGNGEGPGNGLIEKAIFGEDYTKEEQLTLGKRLSLSVWGLFLQKTTDDGKAAEAYTSIFEKGEDASAVLFFNINATTSDNTNFFKRLTTFYLGVTSAVANPIGGAFLIAKSFGVGENNRYQVAYVVFISFICGFYMLWSFIKMGIDVSYRAIKLYALRLLSPIAIVSYIDPKSGKNGVFSKWLAECVKTYASLFVRVFVFAIASVILNEIDATSTGDTFIERLFFILAVVAFIKTAPKFIDGILGTELSKDSESKFGSDLLKQGLGGLGMAAVGGAVGLATATKRGYNGGRGFWEGTKAGFTGGIEAVNKKDPIGVIGGLAKAGNGANAWRKYYGLPTAAEDRKKKTEADLAKGAAEKFSAVKADTSKKKFDKMDEDKFNAYINGSNVDGSQAILDAAETNMKNRWNNAMRIGDEVEKDRIKMEFTNKRFREGYKEKDVKSGQTVTIAGTTRDAAGNAIRPDADKIETTLAKIQSSDRAAKYRASIGSTEAIKDNFSKDSEIGKHWLEEEKWSREKTAYEDQTEIFSTLATTAGSSRRAGGGYVYCNQDGSEHHEFDELASKFGITKTTDPATGTDTYMYNSVPYNSEFDVVSELINTNKIGQVEVVREQDLINRANVARNHAGYAASKVEEEKTAREDRMKNPQNASDSKDARVAQLIEAGKKRGY